MTAKLHQRPRGDLCNVHKSKPARSGISRGFPSTGKPASSRDPEFLHDAEINPATSRDIETFSTVENAVPVPSAAAIWSLQMICKLDPATNETFNIMLNAGR